MATEAATQPMVRGAMVQYQIKPQTLRQLPELSRRNSAQCGYNTPLFPSEQPTPAD